MTLRGLIFGIAVWLLAAVFIDSGWAQSQSSPKSAGSDPGFNVGFDSGPSYNDPGFASSEAIKKSLERVESESERLAIEQIITELDKKSNRDLLTLKLASHICQDIDCRDVSPDMVRRYFEVYAEARVAEDTHQTALRSAAAAERSTLIATVSASVSLLSLLISVLSYRRTVRSSKSALPA
ncbi:MAG: hypothetical protein ACREC0_13475 [Methylocella sp.]